MTVKNYLSDVWELYVVGKNFKWRKVNTRLDHDVIDNYGLAYHSMCAVYDVEIFWNAFLDKFELLSHPAFVKWKIKQDKIR